MMHSGDVFSWPKDIANRVVDKHSSGGVGDKISLPLAPALAVNGLYVPMISGRSLMHTGGTLDKLEAINDYKTLIETDDILRIVKDIGCVICGQTASLVPADKKMYALRDVSGTVASLPLIVASICSKKLAEGISALVLDTKCGRGAFMKTKEEAVALGSSMQQVCQKLGVNTVSVVSQMDEPIGNYVGNSLEVYETLLTLEGKGPSDTEDQVATLGGVLLTLTGQSKDYKTGIDMIRKTLHDGSALAKFHQMVKAHGGDLKQVLNSNN